MDNILSLESVLSGAGYDDDDMSLEMEGMDAVTACELSDVFEDVTTLEANLVICEAALTSCTTDEEYNNIITVEGNTWDKIVDKVREMWQALVDFIKSVFLKIKAFFLNTERYWKDNKDDIKAGINVAKADDKVSLKHGIIMNNDVMPLVLDIDKTMRDVKSIQSNIDRLTEDSPSKNILNKNAVVSNMRKAARRDLADPDEKNFTKVSNVRYGVYKTVNNGDKYTSALDDVEKTSTRKAPFPVRISGINTDNIIKFLERANDILNSSQNAVEVSIANFKGYEDSLLGRLMCTKVLITNLTEAKKFCSQQASNHRFKSGEGAKASLKFCKLVKKVISTCIRVVQLASFEALKVCKAAVAKAGE